MEHVVTQHADPATQHEPVTPPSRGLLAAVGGLVGGVVTVGVAEFLAGVFLRLGWSDGTPSPVLAVGGAFIDRTPPWLKTFAVDNFGTHDKQVLLAGMAVVLTVLSLLIGRLCRRHFTEALVGFVVLIAIAAAAVTSRPHAAAVDLGPLLIGAVLGLLTLFWWRDRILLAAGPADPSATTRRAALAGVGAIVGAAVLGFAGRAWGNGARAVQSARAAFVLPHVAHPVTVPRGASVGVAGVTPYIVPSGDFYRIDTAIVVPQVDPASWKLRVTGMVDHEVEIDWETLRSRSTQQAMITLMCVSNEVGGNLIGNTIWTGWPVRELLAQAGVQAGADMVLSRSVDGFTAGTPLPALTDGRNALIAIAMDGEALPAEHGFPARLVVPGLYGYVSATKWVTELKVTTFARDAGYWTPRGWSARGPVKTSSRIDVPRSGAKVAAGTVAVAGVAWHQHVGIAKVQVRVDDGPWRDARLGAAANIDVWRQWVYEWQATPGHHTLTVRAVDDSGAVQIAAQAPPAPNGSTGYHSVSVTVH
ncbi:molybdopterin-dependent oxidoreductase [Flexivirga oryzae]|uniref:DMSO/TMAO reductase YedYZ molybdopterin-dependent catalytic subunit n=1 Tax=Flexivirga oryzae TaxID=1794944 RepID=A0A839N6J0_9MICO|nr:molybdopterin-dependent oxidoreductase [Flexivirga oryzae]MBB2890371.1 DMSO/TMAO reductase YedYZ molybdopterin-dependent catalytic subunit [Flexivirga oryzae]